MIFLVFLCVCVFFVFFSFLTSVQACAVLECLSVRGRVVQNDMRVCTCRCQRVKFKTTLQIGPHERNR